MANYNSSYTGAQIDSAVGRANSTDVTAGTVAASKAVVVDSNKDVTGFRNITGTGTATFANFIGTGDIDIGDASGDTVTITASVDSNIVPSADDTYDLGGSSAQWKDLYVDGTAYIDAIDFNGTAITSTGAELNLIDGGTARGTTAVATGDGILINDAGTMRMTNVDTVSTYFASHNVGGGNIVTTGALDSGSITSGFGAIDNGTSGIRTNTFTAETSIIPDASGGADIGSTSAEWGDVFIADDKKIKFGNDQDFTIEYDEDGSDIAQFAGADIGMDANYIVNEQGRQDHVANTMSAPYYRFDGVDDYIKIDHVIGDFGSTNGTISAWIYRASSATSYYLCDPRGDGGGGTGYYYFGGGSDTLSVSDGTVYVDGVASTTVSTGKWHHVVITGTTINIDEDFKIGRRGSTAEMYFPGQISDFKIFNLALTAAEVKELSSGASVPFKYKGANQTDMVTNGAFAADTDWNKETGWTIAGGVAVATSAANNYTIRQTGPSIVLGKAYRVTYTISGYSAGTVKIILGGNTVGTGRSANGTYTEELVSTGSATTNSVGIASTSTTTLNIDNFSVVPIGAVAEYDGSGVGASRWDDKSGNELHGTVYGATVENAPADADSGLTYEEGTWEGVLTDGTNPMTMNSTYDTGYYTKVGNLVTVTGYFVTTSVGSASGNIRITGLPFANGVGWVNCNVGHAYAMTITAGESIGGFVRGGNSYIELRVWDDTGGTTAMQASEWQAAGQIILSFSYRAA